MPLMLVVKLLTGVLFGLLSLAAMGTTLAALQEADNVRVTMWLEPQSNIIARQQIKLQIQISTDTRFSAGTRIGAIEIQDAIVLQREKFALNAVQTVGNKSWTIQQWTLVVYPQRGGQFEIPEIPLHISVMGEGSQSIIGKISSAGLSFTATVPEQMADKPGWVATTRYEVEEHFDKPLDQLKPGDALVRTTTISADNLSAMMLPTHKAVDINGIVIYPAPAQLNDQTNRGEYRAERTAQVTYIFEQAGDFQLPPQTFYWWNLDTQSLEFITLASHDLKITGGQGASGRDDEASLVEDGSQFGSLIPALKKAGIVLLLAFIIWYVGSKVHRRLASLTPARSVQVSERALRKQFEAASRKGDLEKAIGLFYHWLDCYGGEQFKGSVRESLRSNNQAELSLAFNESMASIYGSDEQYVELDLFAKRFFKVLKKADKLPGIISLDLDLKLN